MEGGGKGGMLCREEGGARPSPTWEPFRFSHCPELRIQTAEMIRVQRWDRQIKETQTFSWNLETKIGKRPQ